MLFTHFAAYKEKEEEEEEEKEKEVLREVITYPMIVRWLPTMSFATKVA